MSTRSEALENLNAYVKYSGANYRSNRNYAEKLGTRQNVSSLSPYIRYRLISEEEVILQVLTQNSYSAAEKFIQEVFWRTYWKGWMQLRPHLFDVYLDEVHYLRENLKVNNALEENYLAAINGQTGIACFDDWLTELVKLVTCTIMCVCGLPVFGSLLSICHGSLGPIFLWSIYLMVTRQ